ncbi:hypothetical protein [Embleya sp. NBC_00896]|uniref:hypothetical protein n=1 Tax=Embleya sp. NBC_00896 TaxID=2975961 RepID=UPI002F91A715|nr:hypothetical protein OG928_44415 [Embleya sp. NBC_00896]
MGDACLGFLNLPRTQPFDLVVPGGHPRDRQKPELGHLRQLTVSPRDPFSEFGVLFRESFDLRGAGIDDRAGVLNFLQAPRESSARCRAACRQAALLDFAEGLHGQLNMVLFLSLLDLREEQPLGSTGARRRHSRTASSRR